MQFSHVICVMDNCSNPFLGKEKSLLKYPWKEYIAWMTDIECHQQENYTKKERAYQPKSGRLRF